MSSEPDGGFYRPDGDHNGDGIPHQDYAYEAAPAVAGVFEPTNYGVPSLAVGVSFDRPGCKPATNFIDAIRYFITTLDHAKRGYDVGDRAYFDGSKAENFHDELRVLGFLVIGDYQDRKTGHQDTAANGAIMVDGNFYCPSMPKLLVDATPSYRGVEGYPKIDKSECERRLEQRQVYLLGIKQVTDSGSHHRCPAKGPNPKVTCPFVKAKPPKMKKKGQAEPRKLLPVIPTGGPCGDICTNKDSSLIRRDELRKFRQDGLVFMSPEWRRVYPTMRNISESNNHHFKNDNAAVGSRSRRLVRGFIAHWAMAALGLVASNIAKINAYLDRVKSGKPVRGPEPDPMPDNRPEKKDKPFKGRYVFGDVAPGAPPIAARCTCERDNYIASCARHHRESAGGRQRVWGWAVEARSGLDMRKPARSAPKLVRI